jgi:ankyrin repeat protein
MEYDDKFEYNYSEESEQLFTAIKNNELDKVTKLITEGKIDVNIKHPDDYCYADTPLLCACAYKKIEIIKFLIENGANLNDKDLEEGNTVLIHAFPDIDTVRLLIDNGADVNSKNKSKETALIYLSEILNIERLHKKSKEDCFNIIKLLIDRGADINHLLDNKDNNYILKKYYMSKAKETSNLLREELIAKYYCPENIEKWSITYNKPFDEIQDIM